MPHAADRETLAVLRARSSSPYAPEPPRAHPIVSWIARRASQGAAARATPHLSGCADVEKTRYEYAEGPAFVQAISPWLPSSPLHDKSLLDVGCGWGGKAIYCAEVLQPSRIEGFDLPGVFEPAVPLAFAVEKGVSGCAFRTGYAEKIPYSDGEFDILVCEDVLEHVEDPGAVLRECRRVLRSGGRLVALFPSFRMLDAHHLDRAVNWPGLHYLLSMKTWAGGLNHYLLATEGAAFEPFSEAVGTRFHACVTRNLNGMSFRHFAVIAGDSGLVTRELRLLPRPTPDNGRSVWLKKLYRRLSRTSLLGEILSQRILYVATKP